MFQYEIELFVSLELDDDEVDIMLIVLLGIELHIVIDVVEVDELEELVGIGLEVLENDE